MLFHTSLFFLGRYTATSMEHMRGSLSIIFFLLGILAVNDGKTKKFLLYFLVAVLFHVFTIFAVFLFVIGYYLNSTKACYLLAPLCSDDCPDTCRKGFYDSYSRGCVIVSPQ